MTARQGYNRILSAEALQSLSVCSSARSAHLAKAQPSLRVGAGGVGGLVAVSIDGDYYFPGYDNNGNVIGYWDEFGSIVAEYAYDAFGNTISATGSMASVFPHRFSTKYYDAETDLYYYGYRYYSPSLGRWISRDPIGENGGNNLFSMCNNRPTALADFMGLDGILFLKGDESGSPVVSVDDIPVFPEDKSSAEVWRAGIFYDYPYNQAPVMRYPVKLNSNKQICEIQFHLHIGISSDVYSKNAHDKDEIVGYNPHLVEDGGLKSCSSLHPIYPATLRHERGHAKAYLEVLRPILERELVPLLNSKKYVDENAAKMEVVKKVAELSNNMEYLQKSAKYANEGTIGYYTGNVDYLPIASVFLTNEYGVVDRWEWLWRKQ